MPSPALVSTAPTLAALLLAAAGARPGDPPECADPYRGAWNGDGGRATYCEVRTLTLPTPGAAGLTVDGGSDGGATVRGADTARAVTVRAVVRAWGETAEQARATAAPVRVDSSGGDVVAHSNNGGAQATLAGAAWDGAGLPDVGLDLSTNNGGAVLRVPDGYSARLRAEAGNGPLTVAFPVTVQRGAFDRRTIEATLGAGGAPVRVSSNNGGLRLERAGAAGGGGAGPGGRE